MDNALKILPDKLLQVPTDAHPCVRPLTEAECAELCAKYKVTPEWFRGQDFERLADALPSRTLARLCLITDVASMETIDLATQALAEIAKDAKLPAKDRIEASRELGKLQEIRSKRFDYLMAEAEKSEEKVKKEKHKNLPPGSINLQVNVSGTQGGSALKSDSEKLRSANLQ